MDADMAPPHKRRRLSSSASQRISSQSEKPSATVEQPMPEPSPTLSHSVEHLEHIFATPTTRPVPHHIEEVHLQIQQRAVNLEQHDEHLHVHRRQGTAPASDVTLTVTVSELVYPAGETSMVTGGNAENGLISYLATDYTTIISIVDTSSTSPTSTSSAVSSSSSATSSAASNASSSPSSSSGTGSGFIGNSAGTITSSGSSATTISGTGSSGTAISSTGSATSTNSTSTAKSSSIDTSATSNSTSTLTSTTSTSHQSSSQTSLAPNLYIETLSNGNVVTLSRSQNPYTTTFPDGQKFTISPRTSAISTATDSNGKKSTVYSTLSPPSSSIPADQSTVTSMAIVGGGGTAASASQSSTTTSTSSHHHNSSGSSTTAPPGTIAGGTIGGVAGLAVLLLVALVFLRWYKRRSQQGHQALPLGSDTMSPDPENDRDQASSSARSGPGMAERAGLMPLVAAVPGLFRHQNRSTDSNVPPSSSGAGGERGFTRVSGRKLPSAFSEGMSTTTNNPYAPPIPPRERPNLPLTGSNSTQRTGGETERNLSSTSFYRDSQGFYGGEGGTGPSPASHSAGETPPGVPEYGEMTLSPGPQRRPTVHAGGPYTMSPPATPVMVGERSGLMGARTPELDGDAGGTRSETPTSIADNRSSRFTEEV